MTFAETSEEVSAGDAPINPVDVRFAAMNYLARREHSQYELRRKLFRRFSDRLLIDNEIQQLAHENLQSDERFAGSYLRQRSGRGFGPLRIRQEMRERGLSDAQIEAAFSEEEINWFDVAAQAYAKKYGRVPTDLRALDIKERSRRTRFFQYRGFVGDHYRHLFGD